MNTTNDLIFKIEVHMSSSNTHLFKVKPQHSYIEMTVGI